MRRLPLVLALVASGCASALSEPSPPPPPPPPDVAPTPIATEPKAADLSALDGTEWQTVGDNGWRRTYRFDGDHYRASGNPAWEESGRVELLDAGEHRLHVRFVDREFDGHGDDPLDAVLLLSDDGRSFDMNGERYEALPQAAVVAAGSSK
jgi:hypothetical protein